MQPAIILVSPEHSDFLLDEFGRYQRDYDLHALTDVSRAGDLAHEISATGGQVAMLVADSALGEVSPLSAFQTWRQVVPTAKRLVVAHWDRFLADAEHLRHGLAKGKFDAYLLMPRGVRDEEFHTAVTELLSDWGSTVAAPEVETVRLVSPIRDALTLAIRDFLDRMGMPNRVHDPDSEVGREIIARFEGGEVRFPLVESPYRGVEAPTSVRDVASAIYGRPEDIDVDTVADLCIVGAGPAGLAAAVYGASEGLSTARRRGRGDRRPGRHVVDDPQLPRLPARRLGHAAGPARAQPGDPLRHPLPHRLGGHRGDPGSRRGCRTSCTPTAATCARARS